MIKRSVKMVTGILLLLLGIIITPMPIPLGIILIILGLSMLVGTIPKVRHFLQFIRRRYRAFSHKLNRIKHRLPAFARQLIEDTDPDQP
jgi:sulfite exporter TauE/SafE